MSRIDGFHALEIPDTGGLDVVEVSTAGEDFDLKGSLAKDKVTIVLFSADWCMPCKMLEKKLVRHLGENQGFALRTVNIVDWESEVAKTKLKGVNAIPYVFVFDSAGKEIYRGTGDFEDILELLEGK